MNYLDWRTTGLRKEDGIIIASDITQEWLLPWWWNCYRKHNSLPVAFVDFGMSFEKKDWCRERGELIPLRLLDDFIKTRESFDPAVIQSWEKEFGKHFWNCRNAWFKKPFAFLQTPFQRSIWMDLDCEVRGSLEKLFDYADQPAGIAMASYPSDGLIDKKYPIYNSGVVAFRRNIDLVLEWARNCIKKNDAYCGDQEVLSSIIGEKHIAISNIPLRYNWSRMEKEDENVVVFHWHGSFGKYCIQTQINVENLPF